MRVLGTFVAATIAGGACGDTGRPQLTADEVLARLRALPGVTAEEMATQEAGLHYFVLHFTQPVDHTDPSRGTFPQEVSLLHKSEQAPMIVHTSGYMDYFGDATVELTQMLDGNQVSIEHRFYGDSRPSPADWSQLTIAQMAADEHDIITALRTIYEGAFLSTGGSKGGTTAVFHRRFYPDDVDGTVAYVAPLSFDIPDHRYAPFLDAVGPPECRQKVRDVATELLSHRRDAMVAHAQAQPGHVYGRVAVGAAVEIAIVGLEWGFWQKVGIAACNSGIPAVDASDDDLFAFLDSASKVSDDADDVVPFYEPYYYQSYAELGYPDYGGSYLEPFRAFHDPDYVNELPTPSEPVFDSQAMQDVDSYVSRHGNRLLFIYGELDPWTAGKFALGDATDSAVLVQPNGKHDSSIYGLDPDDRDEALAKLKSWTGVTPNLDRVKPWTGRAAALVGWVPPRMPAVLARHAQK
jgi:hypothetical protein